MFALKPISHESVAGALAKAERYRLLDEPAEAESICRDILAIEPEQPARADRPRSGAHRSDPARSQGLQPRPRYRRASCNRPTIAPTMRASPGSAAPRPCTTPAPTAPATRLRMAGQSARPFRRSRTPAPAGNDDALLRWNTCVRFLARHRELVPASKEEPAAITSE